MNVGLRTWILILAVVCFTAGIAAGRILGERAHGPDEGTHGKWADFEARFTSQFELSPERSGHLHTILQKFQQDLETIKNDRLSEYRSAIEPEIRTLARRYDNILRDKVLPPQKRALFDQLSFAAYPLDI